MRLDPLAEPWFDISRRSYCGAASSYRAFPPRYSAGVGVELVIERVIGGRGGNCGERARSDSQAALRALLGL